MSLIAGDRVRLNIDAIEKNGMNETRDQIKRFKYIMNHPDEIYKVAATISPGSLAQIELSHPLLGSTSFFEDEIIKIND